jgi:hypothetical protein
MNKQKVWIVKDLEGPQGGIKYVARDVYEAGGTLGIAPYCLFPKKKWPNKVGPVRSETCIIGVKLVTSIHCPSIQN